MLLIESNQDGTFGSYVVTTPACRKNPRRKAYDGLLIEKETPVDKLRFTARWSIEAEFIVTHTVCYSIIDNDFDAASEYWAYPFATRRSAAFFTCER